MLPRKLRQPSSQPMMIESEVAAIEALGEEKVATKMDKKRTQNCLSTRSTVRSNRWTPHCLVMLALVGAVQLLLQQSFVTCQSFEDLSKQQQSSPAAVANHQQHMFQPLNRLNTQQTQQITHSKHHFQRPNLSNRFAPAANAPVGSQLATQASSPSATFVSEPSVAASAQPQSAALVQQPPASPLGGASNIEIMMKNALARTAQLNSAAVVESRQDTTLPVSAPASAQESNVVSRSVGQQRETATGGERGTTALNPQTSDSEEVTTAMDGEEKQTTASQLATTTNGHETVYSDQRFANLFARRNSGKKSRLTPQEQVKAKPTLPSFIKSPPDPKQFSATSASAVSQENAQGKPALTSASSSFAAQRLQQQQNQGRINLANQQRKAAAAAAAITSNSAATANNKRANALNARAQSSPSPAPKSSANQKAGSSAAASKPTPSSNNPFSRPQAAASNDQASMIALARKRLLANNALESAKLKQNKAAAASATAVTAAT